IGYVADGPASFFPLNFPQLSHRWVVMPPVPGRAFRGKAMSRLPIPIWIVALAVSPGFAQPPPVRQATYGPAGVQGPAAAPGVLPAAITENRIRFNTDSIEVKQNGPRWQIWDGKTLVRDFADNRDNAFEARQL